MDRVLDLGCLELASYYFFKVQATSRLSVPAFVTMSAGLAQTT